jgi:hypothetical protein
MLRIYSYVEYQTIFWLYALKSQLLTLRYLR